MTFKGFSGWKSLGFESYQDYLVSDLWKDKRKWILEVLGYGCSKCEATKDLQVHHTNYNSLGNEGIDDVIILCRNCHNKEHGKNSS